MRPEDQVPDLALCQRLKELGMPQDTYFFWNVFADPPVVVHPVSARPEPDMFIAAPTVGELGEMLPAGASFGQKYSSGEWLASEIGFGKSFTESKEARARAKLLIWLAENSHVRWTDAA